MAFLLLFYYFYASILIVWIAFVGSDPASQHSKQLIPFIDSKQQRVIIYVDFIKDAAPLAISLRQAGFKTCS